VEEAVLEFSFLVVPETGASNTEQQRKYCLPPLHFKHTERLEMCFMQTALSFTSASLAYSINKYTNIKKRLLTCNANIYFNKSCLAYKVIPKYAQINLKTSNTSEVITNFNIKI
jgi:hypothetical protein